MKTMINHQSSPPIWVNLLSTVLRAMPAGRYRLMNQLCRRSNALFIKRMPDSLGGYLFTCDLRDAISREVCFTGGYEPQETALVRAIMKPGMCFVDVGANWGYFTLLAAHLVGPRGRVLSLEPDPRLFAKLEENLRRNRIDQVTALPIAAADEAGNLLLGGYDEHSGNFGLSSLVHGGLNPSQSFRVASDAIDRILDRHQLDSVDLMKIDIEGAEALALIGLKQSLASGRIKRLLLELHPAQLREMGSSTQAVMQLLLQSDYSPVTIDHSPHTTRDLAYHQINNLEQILTPVDPSAPIDAWPHQLWCAPGISAL